MHTLDWESLLRNHPAFEMLDDEERHTILAEQVATERVYQSGERILHQGDIGNSVYVIGEGTAEVVLEKPDDRQVVIYSIGRGELFGEMAVIEDRPRAATLIATEKTVVLEIRGEAFLALIKANAEIGLVMLQSMSRRLRITDTKITEKRLFDHDEAIAILSAKIDAAIEAADAKLEASRTMYDQTTRRANEIIDSADRARNTMKWSLSTAAAVLALLGAFGLWDIKEMRSNVQDDRAEVQAAREQVQAEVEAIQELRAEVQGELDTRTKEIEKIKTALQTTQGSLKLAQEGVQTEIERIRDAAGRIEQFTAEAEAEQRMAEFLAELSSPSLKTATKEKLADALNGYDPQTVQQLGLTLTKWLQRGTVFHNELASLLEPGSVESPDGRLFLTYFLALSALSEGTETQSYRELKFSLRDTVLLTTDEFSEPTYVSENSGPILTRFVTRAGDIDPTEKAARAAEVEELIALLDEVKAR